MVQIEKASTSCMKCTGMYLIEVTSPNFDSYLCPDCDE